MHDTLVYLSRPVHRTYHHHELTFRVVYAFSENFMLPLSHDEVVHGKGSLLGEDAWRRLAEVRHAPSALAYMFAQPGKKLLFMGAEFAQRREWNHDEPRLGPPASLPPTTGCTGWSPISTGSTPGSRPSTLDCDPAGFEWAVANDWQGSPLPSCARTTATRSCWSSSTPRRCPVTTTGWAFPGAGFWTEILNSDALIYGGSGHGNLGEVEAVPNGTHGRPFSIGLTLPPLAGVMLRCGPAKPG